MSVSERGYLSIGEVLALLQEEFPDVTISKIRFLESQGLIEPERTHSGYRKFYGPDVDRLRFILREQREHYLPLRVIRDRLDAAPEDADVDVVDDDDIADDLDDAAAAEPVLAVEDEHDATHHAAVTMVPPLTLAALPATTVGLALDGELVPTLVAATPDDAAPAPHVPVWMRKAPPGIQPRPLAAAPPLEAQASRIAAEPAAAPPPEPPAADRAVPASAPPGVGPDAELTLDELAEAAGVTPAVIRELESFGLLSARVAGRTPYYDSGALAAARLAAGFQRHGIEARHLRLYKQFVEREAALFEQVILPLTKQRNPRARAQASEALHDLAKLGASMRELFVATALRDLEP